MNAAEVREQAMALGPYLGEHLGGDGTVAQVRLAGEGMSDTTLLVDLADGRELVVRAHRDVVGGSGDQSPEQHFAILRALNPVDEVPSPEALHFEPDPELLGAPFLVTGRLPGHAVVPWSRDGRRFLNEAGAGPAGRELFEILARIHAVDPSGLGDVLHTPGPGTAPAEHSVGLLRAAIERDAGGPEPVLADALGWLENHLPECEQPGLVHGDYRAGNLLFHEGHISGVLDWEFAHAGDPTRDIAWIMGASNRVADDMACDMVPLDEVPDRYADAGGRRIDPAALKFWDLFMLAENAAIWVRSTAAWRRGDIDDVRVARWSYTLAKTRGMVFDALEAL